MGCEANRCNKTSTPYGIFIVIPSLEGQTTKVKEAPSPHEVRLTPLDTNWVFQCLGDKRFFNHEALQTMKRMYINITSLPNTNSFQYSFSEVETEFVRQEIQNLLEESLLTQNISLGNLYNPSLPDPRARKIRCMLISCT